MLEPMQSLWIGAELGPLQHLSIASFLAAGHPYHLYAYTPIANVPAGTELRDATEILPADSIFTYEAGPGAGSPSAFANLFRYALLEARGGWWVDTDVVCIRPFVTDQPRLTCSEKIRAENGVQLNCAVMRFPAGDPFMRICKLAATHDPMRSKAWGTTGPHLLNRLWMERPDLRPQVAHTHVFSPVTWWDWQVMVEEDPSRCRALIARETIGIHLYNEMWRRAGVVDPTTFPPTSYARLLIDHFCPDLIGNAVKRS